MTSERDPNTGPKSELDSLGEAVSGGARAEEKAPDEDAPAEVAHFKILGRLGSGGMGVVYRAEDSSLHRIVALKVLRRARGTEEAKARFLREARSAAAITHPNVAVVHQVGEADGHVYIAMELIAGERLRDVLARGRIERGRAYEYALQIARALAAAHEKGIVHRDLKPENVMITNDGVVKLLDFGLAKGGAAGLAPLDAAVAPLSRVTGETGRVMGTPAYMSPEQAMGDLVDVRSDVFSFGVLLYELLSGARPFDGSTSNAMLVAIVRDSPPPVAGLDAGLSAVLARCLAKAPSQRFANAGELVSALLDAPPTLLTTLSRSVAPVEGPEQRAAAAWGRLRGGAVRAFALLFVVAAAVVFVGSSARSPKVQGVLPVSASAAERARASSPVPDAQRLFDEALLSLHDGRTGQAIALLESAVAADSAFGGAYLRLWLLTGVMLNDHEKTDEYFQRAAAREARLSPEDRALFDCFGDVKPSESIVCLEAYLRKFPDDDLGWVLFAKEDGIDRGVLYQALDRKPALVPLLATVAEVELLAGDNAVALPLLSRCLEVSPHAVDCLEERAALSDRAGNCTAAFNDISRAIELDPGARKLQDYKLLAGVLAGEGEPLSAVREAFSVVLSRGGTYSGEVGRIDEALLPLFEGDFVEAERVAALALSRVPPSAPDIPHVGPVKTLIEAYEESGDFEAARRTASDYLARRSAWSEPATSFLGFMTGAAFRGQPLDAYDRSQKLDAIYRKLVDDAEFPPAMAWAAAYAAAAVTKEESIAAVAKLDVLGLEPPREMWPSATVRVFSRSGRGEVVRPSLDWMARTCSSQLLATRNWVHAHLYLGELDEASGATASACSHFAKVEARWGHAKPRSLAADEARQHALALHCPR